MTADTRELDGIGRADLAVVGGKAANLGELSRLGGVHVPPGYVVTAGAFRRFSAGVAGLDVLRDRLEAAHPADGAGIRSVCAELRAAIDGTAVPAGLAAAITRPLAALGEGAQVAVRSSATAEDLPGASFAGQHDSYLGVAGPEAVLAHVRRCWASLFTDRAVAYRRRRGIGERGVAMAVIVQRMVPARAAGVLFTADPVTSDRRVSAVEAVAGLADGLVSGVAAADAFTVREGRILGRRVAGERPVLTDAEALALAGIGRRIERHLGRPQDVEWCLAGEGFRIVQARPITTLFPIPERADDAARVYLSVGHQQMMTDPMRALGRSVFQLTALPVMHEAGGRLFVDVTDALAAPGSRAGLLGLIGRSDPLTRDALEEIVARGFVPAAADAAPAAAPTAPPPPLDPDPAVVADLVARGRRSVVAAEQALARVSGTEVFDVVEADIQELRRFLWDPTSQRVIMAAMEALWWLEEHLEEWLGERGAADALTRSVPGNVTSEMGLALLDVADVVRAHPEVVALLEDARDDGFLDDLDGVPGGRAARDAIRAYLERYGMRCVGEIDITRPRWAETPVTLVPVILGHVRDLPPGEAARRFAEGRRRAAATEKEVLARLRARPDGARAAAQTARMIATVRAFAGYREYPKYLIVSRYMVYKRALLREAARLAARGVVGAAEDVFDLTFGEFREAVRTGRVDPGLVMRRREDHRAASDLVPPRVLTSEGEVLSGRHRDDALPSGALAGLAVSAGVVEGRARVVLDMAGARIEPGDVLVTAFTDPSWTPLFVPAAALVTEVGGRMTHGAVIAREYGLPAVVAVDGATRRIRDGQRIRVDGTAGFVEILG